MTHPLTTPGPLGPAGLHAALPKPVAIIADHVSKASMLAFIASDTASCVCSSTRCICACRNSVWISAASLTVFVFANLSAASNAASTFAVVSRRLRHCWRAHLEQISPAQFSLTLAEADFGGTDLRLRLQNRRRQAQNFRLPLQLHLAKSASSS